MIFFFDEKINKARRTPKYTEIFRDLRLFFKYRFWCKGGNSEINLLFGNLLSCLACVIPHTCITLSNGGCAHLYSKF